jgi:hypothetical protein
MPIKKSNPQKRSRSKGKPTAKSAAAERIATRRRSGGRPTMPASEKQRSQSRFPHETPLTGEDRPARRAGGKKIGQSARRSARDAWQ